MRVQINLSDSAVKKIDNLAEAYGVSRSALCSTIIGQYIFSTEQVIDMLKSNTAKSTPIEEK